MLKRLQVVAAACGVVVVAAVGAATPAIGAGPPATGNCPDSFTLQDTSFLNSYSVGGLQSADLNGNGKTCVKLLNTPSDIVFMDDVMSKT